jgi:TrmH family RNA methyltransferase
VTPGPVSDTNARLVSARRLTSRKGRRETGLFLAEGAQAVREALAADAIRDLFATAEAIERNGELLEGQDFVQVSDRAAASLSETVTPQGIVAVCNQVDVDLEVALAGTPRLGAVLVDCNDPGNAGSVLRSADAAGADVVIFVGGVDPYNGKTVRATAGSLFHVPIVVSAELSGVEDAAHRAGLRVLATSGGGSCDLDQLDVDGSLRHPSLWLFGSEAHGLPDDALGRADFQVRIPIHGRAESLNLAAAAAVCLYASARAQHR